MSYGHAERNLAAVRALTAETVELLRKRDRLTADQRQWLIDVGRTWPNARSSS